MLLGLTGPAGVGKDTVAQFLAGYGFVSYAFAKPLKEALSVLDINEPDTREAKEQLIPNRPYSYRTAAQRLGTEFARAIDPDFWLKLAASRTCGNYNTVVTDVRFENEATWVRKQGGLLVHIIGRRTTVNGINAKHSSENGVHLLSSDVILDNSGDKIHLLNNVKQLVLKDIPLFVEKQHASSCRSEFNSVDVPTGR
jgi:hypothetical protein